MHAHKGHVHTVSRYVGSQLLGVAQVLSLCRQVVVTQLLENGGCCALWFMQAVASRKLL